MPTCSLVFNVWKLRSEELNAWECIPLIFRWPHRKLLSLDIHMELITRSQVQLVDEGIALRIFNSSDGEDYLQSFRDSTASLQTPQKGDRSGSVIRIIP